MFFQNKEHGIVIHITKQTTKQELYDWLKENHHEIFIWVEPWEIKDPIDIDENEITFDGDNGLFVLERCQIINLSSNIKEITCE